MESTIGALLALLAIAWIIRAAIGIRRRRITSFGRGGFRRTHHGREAVWAGMLHVGIGIAFFLLGLSLMYVGFVRT